jgi:hypothetical protein
MLWYLQASLSVKIHIILHEWRVSGLPRQRLSVMKMVQSGDQAGIVPASCATYLAETGTGNEGNY